LNYRLDNISRRDLLRLGTAGAAALWVSGRVSFAAAEAPKKKIPIALQLYSVRGELGKDFTGVIEKVGKMGYQGVEFAGYNGWDKKAKDLRKLLDDNGLKCCGTHTGLNTIQGDALKATAELHTTLGNKFLIVPGMSAKDAEGWMDLAKKFNEIAAKAKDLGMRIGYHAHGGDFKKMGDKTAWEILFDNTDKEVVHQMDIGNCLGGGGDPYALIKKYPGRSTTVHLKEHGGKGGAPVGEGTVKWKEVFELCETIGGTEWYIVEHESGSSPLESVKACIDNLRKMGK
jgi:sugar phosphate isomerase/epimerase